MTPTNSTPSTPWWQTLLVTIANVALGALFNHYFGPVAAVGAMGTGTIVAHALPSPLQQK